MERKKIKVLLVSPYSEKKVGGIGTWSKSILDYASLDDSVDLCFQNTKFFLKHDAVKKVSSIERLIVGSLDTLTILIKLLLNMLFTRPDVVHYTSSASWALVKDRIAITIVKKLFKKRFIIHWHFGRIPELCAKKNIEFRRLALVIKKADTSIVIDPTSLLALQDSGFDNVVYIPNPLTQAIFNESLQVKENAFDRREPGMVLFVGHISEAKGVYELVKACVDSAMVKSLYLVGPCASSVKDALMRIAIHREDGNWVSFVGEVPREDVFEYYQRCSVFCLPSYTEGFPYVILEAMAFACPIIATEVGAIPEMLSGGCGEIIKPRQTESVKKAINKLLSNNVLLDDLGRKARNKVLENYSISKVYRKYCEVWHNCLN